MKNYKKFLELQKQVKKYAQGGKVESPHDKKNLQSLKASFDKFIKEESKEKYSEGGQVKESQQKQYQAKEYFGKGSNAGGEGVANSMGIRMSEGGDPADKSAFDELARRFQEAFNTPPVMVPPSTEETPEQRYARIRLENQQRMMGTRPALMSMDPEHQVNGFSGGGTVDKESKEDKEARQKSFHEGSKAVLRAHNHDANAYKWLGVPIDAEPRMGDVQIDENVRNNDRHYADGGFTRDPNNLTPEEYEQSLKDLEAQGFKINHINGDQQNITGQLPPQPPAPAPDLGPYPGEEEDAQKAAGMTTDAQIGLLDRIDQALGKSPEAEKPKVSAEEPNLEQQYAKEDAAAQKNLPNTQVKEEQSKDKLQAEQPEEPIKPYDPIGALKDAQDQRNQSQLINQLGAIAERGAAGYAGIKATQQETFKDNMAIAQQAVDDVKDRIKQQGDDPNSPISTSFKKYLAKFSGEPVSPNMTANAGKEVLPLVFKDYEAKLLQQTRKEMLEDKLKERKETATENRAAEERKYKYLADERKATAKEKALDREAARQLKTEEKQEQFDRKRLDTLGKALTAETASSRSAFGRGANNIRAAEAIEALTDQFKGHLDQMDERQITEVARSLDGLLAQGQPTISGTMHLIPKTAVGNVAKMVEYLRNIPTGQQQGLFVKRMLETVEREKELAKDQIKRVQGKVLGPYMETLKRRPEDAKDILGPHGLQFIIEDSKDKKEASSQSEETKEKQPNKVVVKKGYNAKTNQTQLIYNDGSKEIVDGRQ